MATYRDLVNDAAEKEPELRAWIEQAVIGLNDCRSPADLDREEDDVTAEDLIDMARRDRAEADAEEAREEKWRAYDALVDRLTADAEANGWTVRLTSAAATGSRYYTLSHDDGDEIVVRIADHASCYAREDFSLLYAGEPSGDDHTYESLFARLRQPRVK